MIFSDSILTTPIPINLNRVGDNFMVEWLSNVKGLKKNHTFFNNLSHSGEIKNRVYTNFNLKDGCLLGKNVALPALFIFHMSRCGSTYSANFFATDPKNKVYNEPLLLSRVFSKTGDTLQEQKERLKLAIQLLGAGSKINQKRLIIKMSSIHISQFNLIDELYPQVPKIFIKRNPKEVIVSTVNRPPEHLNLKIKEGDSSSMVCSDYILSILERAKEANFNAVIDYKNLENDLKKLDKQLFNSEFSAERLHLLKSNAANYSKSLGEIFSPDTIAKHKEWETYSAKTKKAIQYIDSLYNMI